MRALGRLYAEPGTRRFPSTSRPVLPMKKEMPRLAQQAARADGGRRVRGGRPRCRGAGGEPELLRRSRRGRAPLGQLAADRLRRPHPRPEVGPGHAPVEAGRDAGSRRLPARARSGSCSTRGGSASSSASTAAPQDAPRTDDARTQYCSFVADLLRDNPEIDDVAIWNDPNDGTFWTPQFDADRQERRAGRLRGAARDLLRRGARRPHERERDRGRRLEELRHSGRVHARLAPAGRLVLQARSRLQGEPPDEADLRHARLHPASGQLRGAAVDEAPRLLGDLARRLSDADVRARRRAFRGTAQPVPGQGSTRIWYLGQGYQTRAGSRPDRASPEPRPTRARCRPGRRRRRPTRARAPASTSRCSSRTRSASPTASRRSARTSTSISTTSATSRAGSPASSGPTGSRRPPTRRFARSAGDVNARSINCASFSSTASRRGRPR